MLLSYDSMSCIIVKIGNFGIVKDMYSYSNLKMVDPDRYFLSLFVKDLPRRQDIQTVDSLNYEIARLRDVIDTPHMGLIRLQWWRDEIRKIYDASITQPHPVIDCLKDLPQRYHLDFTLFDDLLSAREADFEDYDHFDIAAYARNIHLPLFHIKAKILNVDGDMSPLAQAYALIGLIRAIPFYRARTQVLLPQVSPEAVRALCDVAGKLLAEDQLSHRYFRAHNVLARLYVRQIEQAGYNPEKLYPLPFKEFRVWWGMR